MMRTLVLGIDTGGTYTDGVLLDYETKEVVATSKTLTTRHDLTVGILRAIDALPSTDLTAVKLVSISTTLATNAIAEGKGKPAALFLLGYDHDLIRTFNFSSRFATPHYFFIQGGHDLYGNPQAPLDGAALRSHLNSVRENTEAVAISGYFSPLNPAHEEQAASIIADALADDALPLVLGHQLSAQLDSIKRATTASLNASLLPLLKEFIIAVESAMAARGLEAPLMIVRGDGTLIRAEVAAGRPVETIHSGPAASAVGGRFLAGVERALVIDVGGTTTDIAVIDGGSVRVSEAGTIVGGLQTAVQAADIRSIALGGDSHLTFDREDELVIGPARVVPLANLAATYPRVRQELLALRHARVTDNVLDRAEYWFRVRSPGCRPTDGTADTLLRILESEGPQSLGSLLERLGVMHPLQLGADALLKQGLIGRAGLTPTDVLHATGDYTPWDTEVARVVTEKIGRLYGCDINEFADTLLRRIATRIVEETICFLTGRPLPPALPHPDGQVLGRWLFDNNLTDADPYLETPIRLRMPIIGIGAPAAVFLPRVAKFLHTDLILPPHYAVANAVGAVAASVVIQREARIYPRLDELRVTGYYLQVGDERLAFAALEPAIERAATRLKEDTLAAAREAGAIDPHVTVERVTDAGDGYRIIARAVGNPRLMD